MSAYRFFFDQPLPQRGEIALLGSEGRHAKVVMRRKVGDAIALIDGRGGLARARVTKASSDGLVCAIERFERACPPDHRLVLVQAIIQWEALCWVVEKATELGVGQIGFVRRSGAPLPESKLAKLRRIAIAALKQSDGLFLPEVGPDARWGDWAFPAGAQLVLADPEASSKGDLTLEGNRQRYLFVGPEGGFTIEEVQTLRALGARGLNLGPMTLRSETAAICGLFWLSKFPTLSGASPLL